MKTHIRDIRLSNNAGMSFPVCYSTAKLLDLDKSRLAMAMAIKPKDATCKRCLSMYPRHYPWTKGVGS